MQRGRPGGSALPADEAPQLCRHVPGLCAAVALHFPSPSRAPAVGWGQQAPHPQCLPPGVSTEGQAESFNPWCVVMLFYSIFWVALTHFLAFMEWTDDIGSLSAAWSYFPVQSSSCDFYMTLVVGKGHLLNPEYSKNDILLGINPFSSPSFNKIFLWTDEN